MAILLASILDADWQNLAKEIQSVDKAGVDGFSIDIMDGNFVPRITFGPHIVSMIRNLTDLPIEVHLMVSNPEKQIESFCDAGADQVLIHFEATTNVLPLIRYVHSRGLSAGLAVLCDTDLKKISDEVIGESDAINFMAVPVGYGGQKPQDNVIERIESFRARAAAINSSLAIEIDGGMKQNNCERYVQAGADAVVIGTGIYHSDDYNEAVSLAKKNLHYEDISSRQRLEKFLNGNSINFVNDLERRMRLEQLRKSLDIPEETWNPLHSRR